MSRQESLQRELDLWEQDLARLEDECQAEGWTGRERLLATTQRTVATYRGRILPCLPAEHDVAPPALPDEVAPAVVAAYDAVVADELGRAVDTLADLRRELVTSGQTTELQSQISDSLAAIQILTTIVLRFSQEVDLAGTARSGRTTP